MTPEAAVYQFMNSFGIPAMPPSSVPHDTQFPYITYDLVIPDLFEEGNMTVNVWYRTESESAPNAKAREIGLAIPQRAKVPIHCDGGVLLLSRGTPWSQPLTVEGEDEMVKRRLLNVTVESAFVG